ncbi:hypothetical protein F442_18636 [Phytophthora nicotianae P10297]|uniref:Uncharacterized protein n=4 Tax=Phytophthora nicotianae TaxID=4792 RepID=W2PKU9_PHYN3|nr:hypothetical protein PPTG_24120 [Phytophthora nicotianae INRA-310]ETL81709.1 hypothetical protein L917_18016 [Phytophthora nicotianae]ETN01241.1 hypothetical protein PPTG_24120 [Phytophthora nicotianae INRA-310]ETP32720.1 hypothetical protein F442_18636 [Phytophthora nicotianae P10297]
MRVSPALVHVVERASLVPVSALLVEAYAVDVWTPAKFVLVVNLVEERFEELEATGHVLEYERAVGMVILAVYELVV